MNEYDALTEHGARGALLRREGLYQSHVEKWRRARDRDALAKVKTPAKEGSAAEAKEIRRLTEENARLTGELEKTHAVVEVLGKGAPRTREVA